MSELYCPTCCLPDFILYCHSSVLHSTVSYGRTKMPTFIPFCLFRHTVNVAFSPVSRFLIFRQRQWRATLSNYAVASDDPYTLSSSVFPLHVLSEVTLVFPLQRYGTALQRSYGWQHSCLLQGFSGNLPFFFLNRQQQKRVFSKASLAFAFPAPFQSIVKIDCLTSKTLKQ